MWVGKHRQVTGTGRVSVGTSGGRPRNNNEKCSVLELPMYGDQIP